MSRSSALPPVPIGTAARSRRLSTQILLPLTAALLAAVGLTLFGTYWSTSRSDVVSVQRQIRIARHAIDTSVDDLALQQEAVAIWDESAAELAKPKPDQIWLRDNVSVWLHNMFGHDEVIILDGNERPVQVFTEGRAVGPGPDHRLASDVRPLLDGVRGRIDGPNGAHDRNPGRPLREGSTVRTTRTSPS